MAVKQKNLETLWDSLLEWYMDELKAVNAPESVVPSRTLCMDQSLVCMLGVER